mmetsp:Transcript_9592/g.17515  ORF Transcript_9592/g.17515 Transcript_9592/m.17515 type:complete len:315 (-) Transcript_9592:739-1683(-)
MHTSHSHVPAFGMRFANPESAPSFCSAPEPEPEPKGVAVVPKAGGALSSLLASGAPNENAAWLLSEPGLAVWQALHLVSSGPFCTKQTSHSQEPAAGMRFAKPKPCGSSPSSSASSFSCCLASSSIFDSLDADAANGPESTFDASNLNPPAPPNVSGAFPLPGALSLLSESSLDSDETGGPKLNPPAAPLLVAESPKPLLLDPNVPVPNPPEPKPPSSPAASFDSLESATAKSPAAPTPKLKLGFAAAFAPEASVFCGSFLASESAPGPPNENPPEAAADSSSFSGSFSSSGAASACCSGSPNANPLASGSGAN